MTLGWLVAELTIAWLTSSQKALPAHVPTPTPNVTLLQKTLWKPDLSMKSLITLRHLEQRHWPAHDQVQDQAANLYQRINQLIPGKSQLLFETLMVEEQLRKAGVGGVWREPLLTLVRSNFLQLVIQYPCSRSHTWRKNELSGFWVLREAAAQPEHQDCFSATLKNHVGKGLR